MRSVGVGLSNSCRSRIGTIVQEGEMRRRSSSLCAYVFDFFLPYLIFSFSIYLFSSPIKNISGPEPGHMPSLAGPKLRPCLPRLSFPLQKKGQAGVTLLSGKA